MVVIIALAMLTGPWNIRYLRVRKREAIGDLIHPHPKVLCQPVVDVLRPERYIVLCHACHHASPATGALVQVDDHAKPVSLSQTVVAVTFLVMCLFHGYPFLDD
jgi:hypothetical protein